MRELLKDHTVAYTPTPQPIFRREPFHGCSNKQARDVGPGTGLPVPDLILHVCASEQLSVPVPDFPVAQVVLQHIIGLSPWGWQANLLKTGVGDTYVAYANGIKLVHICVIGQ